MRRLLMAMALLVLVSGSAFAVGSNPGVVLAVQGDVLGVATVDAASPCDLIAMPTTCEGLVTGATNTAGDPCAFYLMVVVSPPENTPNFNTVTFGVGSWTGTGYILHTGWCHPTGSELPSTGWPGMNTGTSVSIAPDCWTGNYLQPVYYLGVYNYGTPFEIPLAGHPTQGQSVVDCAADPQLDEFVGLGVIEGANPTCPGGQPEPGACCFGPLCVMLLEELCAEQDGDWYGGVCGTNNEPCPQEPTPTNETTWGNIKSIYR
jgi:hypothetical protein